MRILGFPNEQQRELDTPCRVQTGIDGDTLFVDLMVICCLFKMSSQKFLREQLVVQS